MISIIIPAYNAEKTIRRCVDSLLGGHFQDIEILIADDGSRDATADICRSMQDSRIRFLPAAANGGVSRARNRGLDAAKGEWISFVDADDTVDAAYLEALQRFAAANELDWAAAGFSFVDDLHPERDILSVPLLFDADTVLKDGSYPSFLPDMIFHNHGRCNLASVCGALYKRILIEQAGLRFQEGLRYGEDTLFNLYYSSMAHSFGFLSKPLYRYHQHGSTSTDALFTRYSLQDFAELIDAVEAWRSASRLPLSAGETNYMASQMFGFLNQNAFLKPASARKAVYAEADRLLSQRPASSALWKKMRREDIEGKLARLRFSLIKGRHYHMLSVLQTGIRTAKHFLHKNA